MKTMVVIGNIPDIPKLKKPANLFSDEEIDLFDAGMLTGLSQNELIALRQKLSDTDDWLESGDWDIGDPRWDEYEERLNRISDMIDRIDEILNPESWDEDDDEDED